MYVKEFAEDIWVIKALEYYSSEIGLERLRLLVQSPDNYLVLAALKETTIQYLKYLSAKGKSQNFRVKLFKVKQIIVSSVPNLPTFADLRTVSTLEK